MTEEGDTKDDLKLPADPALRKAIQEAFEAGNDVFVIVIAAMGEEIKVNYVLADFHIIKY